MGPVGREGIIQNLFEEQHISQWIQEANQHSDSYSNFLEKWDFYAEFISGVSILFDESQEQTKWVLEPLQELLDQVHGIAVLIIKKELGEVVEERRSRISFSKCEDCSWLDSKKEREKCALLFDSLKICIQELCQASTQPIVQESNQKQDYTIQYI